MTASINIKISLPNSTYFENVTFYMFMFSLNAYNKLIYKKKLNPVYCNAQSRHVFLHYVLTTLNKFNKNGYINYLKEFECVRTEQLLCNFYTIFVLW